MPRSKSGYNRLSRHSTVWWTRERVIAGGKRFYDDFGILPTNVHDYQDKQQFTGIVRNGRVSCKGYDAKYPSSYAIFKFFDSMRDFWRACGHSVDRGHEDWTQEEDEFILDSVGILPREEVAGIMKRTVPSIKRRLYDLGKMNKYEFGTNSRTRWGWTLSHAAALLNLRHDVLRRYIDRGLLPILQGNKCIYVDPPDLLVVSEYNWAKKRHPKELAQAVRKGLMQRLCFMLLGYDWRKHSIYQLLPAKQSVRTRSGRVRHIPEEPSPRPTGFRIRTRVRVKADASGTHLTPGRVGLIEQVFWAPSRLIAPNKRTRRAGYWAAGVRFVKKKSRGSNTKYVVYNIPLSMLEPWPAKPGRKPKTIKAYRARKTGTPKRAARPRAQRKIAA